MKSYIRKFACAVANLALAFALFAGSSAQAVTQYYDISTNSGLTGGTGAWSTLSNDWASSSAPGTTPPGPWTNGNDAVISILNNAASTITVSNVTANYLSFGGTPTGNKQVTLNDGGFGPLTINAGITNSLTATESVTFNNGIVLGASQAFVQAAAAYQNNMTFNGPITDNGSNYVLTLATFPRTTNPTTGRIILAGTNTFGGGLVILSGWVVGTATNAANGPFGTGGVSLGTVGNASTLTLNGVAANTTTAIGNLTNAGAATIVINNASVANTTTLSAGSLVRGAPSSTLEIVPQAGKLATRENLLFTSAPQANGIIQPWAVSAGSGGDFLSITNATTSVFAASYVTAFAPANVTVVSNATALSTISTSYAVKVAATLDLNGNTLTIGDGTMAGLILTNGNTISNSGGAAALDFGGAETLVYVAPGNTGTIAVPITASTNFTKFGAGNLVIADGSLYAGPTLVNGGTLTFNPSVGNLIYSNSITGAGNLNIAGANQLNISGATTVSVASLTISGSGTLAVNGGIINNTSIALAGAGSTLVITGGGLITNSASIALTGSGSTLDVTNGGVVFTTGAVTVGNGVSNTFALIVGGPTGSFWNLGQSTLTIGNNAATGNVVRVDNGGTLTNGQVTVGNNAAASGNGFVVANGGRVYNQGGDTFIGNANSSSNRVLVTGSSSYWNMNNNAWKLGNGGASVGNTATIDGGFVTNMWNLVVGNGAGNTGNSVIITNSGILATQSAISYVGYGSASNNLVVAGNATWNLGGQYLSIGYGAANVPAATGNVMTVSSGGLVYHIGQVTVGDAAGSAGNSLVVTNNGKLDMTGGAGLVVGNSGNGNSILISGNGASIVNFPQGATIGNAGTTNNFITVGVGGVLSNDTQASSIGNGSNAVGNSLNVNGGNVSFVATTIGNGATSSNNQIVVNSGSITVNGTLLVGTVGSTVNQLVMNGGTATVTALLVTNAGNGVTLSGGTLVSSSTTVSNGQVFAVGDGVHTAALYVLAGTHRFNNGLNVTNNATLAGVGTVFGNVTNSGTLSPGTSVGKLVLSNDLFLTSNAILAYELGTNTTLSDSLVVGGALTLDGTLNVTDAGGLTNGTYTLATCSSLIDSNLNVNNPLPGGRTGTVSNDATHVYLNVTSGTVTDPFVTWQNAYFTPAQLGDPAFSGPNADPLGKGISNTNQFLAGFNPTNSAAYPHVISIATVGIDLNVTYLGASGDSSYGSGPAFRTNVLEFTTGDAAGSYTNSFTSTGVSQVLSNGTGAGLISTMTDAGGTTNIPARYYRVRVLVP